MKLSQKHNICTIFSQNFHGGACPPDPPCLSRPICSSLAPSLKNALLGYGLWWEGWVWNISKVVITANKWTIILRGRLCTWYRVENSVVISKSANYSKGGILALCCFMWRVKIFGQWSTPTIIPKVRLYSHTGKMVALFSGHQREISCVNLADSPPHGMVSGGHDGRVCLYDMRCGKAVLLLRGHKSPVTAVQMDQWKVVSGSCDGFLLVWDQRMAGTLWMMHARHPIDLCHFGGSRLLTANVPVEKNPQQGMWYTDDLVLHRRHRGLIRLLDFGTDNRTVGLPDICTSGYDDTSGYNYNIKLSVPYDTIWCG